MHQRHLGQILSHLLQRVHAVENVHQCGYLIEQILAVAQQRIHQKLFLKESIHRRRLCARPPQPPTLDNRHLRRPVRSPTHAVHRDAILVDFRPRLRIIKHARKHAIRSFTHLDRILSRPRPIDREITDSERKNRAETLRQILFGAPPPPPPHPPPPPPPPP